MVAHVAREISTENANIKPYLIAIDMSSTMFYISHILFGFIKYITIVAICVMPIFIVIDNVSIALFILVLAIYGIGIVLFGALIGSIIRSPTKALLVTIASWIILDRLLSIYTLRREKFWICLMFSFNIHSAFGLAIAIMKDQMAKGVDISVISMFNGMEYQFPMGLAVAMMLIDCVIMFSLLLLIEYLRSNLYFSCCLKESGGDPVLTTDNNRKEGGHEKKRSISTESHEYSTLLVAEVDSAREKGTSDISVRDLVKIYSNGERAVDGLDIQVMRGQVSVLLGHNGAGKSTTFSCITGITKPTSGKIRICGDDVVREFEKTRHHVGFCPQYNPIYNKLTVKEHLQLIHGLKDASSPFEPDATQLLTDIRLVSKQDELATNLSGGMKRKLCLCMAMIGNSKVILLDEPTSGMDPGARKDVQKMLEIAKKNKTILLTTHYMDEAERLGDWVFIMSHGRLAASGTSRFLKQKFGTGYLLTVVFDETNRQEEMAEVLLKTCKRFVKTAEMGEFHGMQLEIILPENEKSNFPDLFKALEAIESEKYDSPSLEKAGISDAKELKITSFGVSLNNLEQVFISIEDSVEKKRAKNSLDEEANRMKNYEALHKILKGILDDLGKAVVMFLPYTPENKMIPAMKKIIANYDDITIRELRQHENLDEVMTESQKEFPAIAFGFEGFNTIYYNEQNYAIYPIAINTLFRALMQTLDARNAVIEPSLQLIAGKHKHTENMDRSQKVAAVFIQVGMFALIVPSFVVFLIEERVVKFAHQQFLTGISPAIFYLGSLLYDLALYSVVCGIVTIIYFSFDWTNNHFLLILFLWFLLYLTTVPFVYAISFLFTSSGKAVGMLLFWLIVGTMIAVFTDKTLLMITGNREVSEILTYICNFLLPLFDFATFLYDISMDEKTSNTNMLVWSLNGKHVVFMASFGLLSIVLFFIFQAQPVQKSITHCMTLRSTDAEAPPPKVDLPQCEAVETEKQLVRSGKTRDCVLIAKDLTKNYGNFVAVNRLCLAIRGNECFGVLGANGAGKTTTFGILTGQIFPSDGEVTIDGKDVSDNIVVGYCPQFDAIFKDFTGRQALELIAQMHGYSDCQAIANSILDCVGMMDHANKKFKNYSGGQRRKISIGVALMAPAKIVILDEPTAGIDPRARREIWELLSWFRQNSDCAIMLTSHSMNECEALCTRIAVMDHGKMIALGTSQDLKSLYGANYTLTLTLKNSDDRQKVCEKVAQKIPTAVLKTAESNMTQNLKWTIPKKSGDKWSKKFEAIQKMAKDLNVQDFMLAQCTLEETFLRLAGLDSERE
ncbi:unnamed protein product [Caenorhabditis bovis]|uniref:ABC transporter domain-containing protein n=1 Tax=Caenorhabditis bovis TaxID=2654633 RepID=A0A8S1EPY2_9PELO|nr:unnamed protein product [Caenorhabditis bovis]